MVYLRPTSDPRKDSLAVGVAPHCTPQLPEDLRLLWAGTNYIHIALQDIKKLRQFIESKLPQNPTDPGDP
jgi:hypothetical protein